MFYTHWTKTLLVKPSWFLTMTSKSIKIIHVSSRSVFHVKTI